MVLPGGLGQHLGVVPAHEERGDERARGLGERVRQDLAPGEALEDCQGEGDCGVEVGAADPRGDVHAERDTQAPGPGDAVVVADPGAHDLRHHAAPEENEDEGAGELRGEFTDQTGSRHAFCHEPRLLTILGRL